MFFFYILSLSLIKFHVIMCDFKLLPSSQLCLKVSGNSAPTNLVIEQTSLAILLLTHPLPKCLLPIAERAMNVNDAFSNIRNRSMHSTTSDKFCGGLRLARSRNRNEK